MKKILSLIIALLITSKLSIYAANWVEVSQGTYVDKDSIMHEFIQGNPTTTYWVQHLNNKNLEVLLNKKISKIITKETAYCGNRLLGHLEAYIYDERNHLIRSDSFYEIYDCKSIIPDSIGEAVYDFVCQ